MGENRKNILSDLGLLPVVKQPVFKALVQSPRLTRAFAVNELIEGGLSHTAASSLFYKMLESNILAAHPDGTVTVHDRFVETFLTN